MKQDSKQDSFNEREIVASATECTGLMPALPTDDPDAQEQCARIYAVHAPGKRDPSKCETKERKQRS